MKLTLDHIGLVVENIRECVRLFDALGFETATEPVADPTQRVSASFIDVGGSEPVYVELLEPTAADSPVSNFLRKKGGLHHLCFEVDDIESATSQLAAKGFPMVCAPVDCGAYDENLKRKCEGVTRIAFFLLSKQILIELIEKGR